MTRHVAAAFIAACTSAGTNADIHIVPAPLVVEAREGSFELKTDARVSGDAGEVVQYAKQAFQLRDVGHGEAELKLVLQKQNPSPGPEGYEIDVTAAGIEVRASMPAGLFYGVQTLRQMIDEKRSVPMGHVSDRPRFVYRGLMLDSCRHFQSIEYVKSFIDRMAELKMNRFHWHLTEDQGWRVQIDGYPELTVTGAYRTRGQQRYGGFYTKAQIREVVAYAKSRFVTIVPEIDMPGHMQAAIASYPQLGCTGKQLPVRWQWGVSDDVLCAGREETFAFCENVLAEVLELFPDSPVIHIGGDECPKVRWKECANCQAKIKQLGMKDEDALQAHFTSRMAKYLESRGRRLQGWNEIMEGGDLPAGVIIQQWNAPSAATEAAKAGHDVVVSPTSHAYFDYTYATIWTRKVYEFEPVPRDLATDLHAHILGPQANLWTEHTETSADVDYMTWPRAVAMAEVGWTARERKSWTDFRSRCENWIGRRPEAERDALRERFDLYADTPSVSK